MAKRMLSGIAGLDELLGGGFPEDSLVMVSGGTGTGKTTLAMEFLCKGATKFNEPGVLISLEQDSGRIIRSATQFGWDLQELIDEKMLVIVSPSVYKFEALEEIVVSAVKKVGARRLVIDSYSIVSTFFDKPEDSRRGLLLFSRKIQQLNCVSLVISDVPEGQKAFSMTGFEEFVADGVLSLELLSDTSRNVFSRAIFVRKMRHTEHSLKRVPFKITSKGVIVYPDEVVFE